MSFVAEKLVDLRKLTWWEIKHELENKDSKIRKLALLRQLSENYWAGFYKNGEKLEVEIYLCRFLDRQSQANLTLIFGCGFMDKAAREKASREIILTVYAFLSRSKVNGTTQGIIDAVRSQPPDENFLRDAEFAVKTSRL